MKTALCLIAAAGLGFGFAAPLQKRATKEAPKFEDLHAALVTQWEGKAFGSCTATLQGLQSLVSKERRKAILASLPTPAGWTVKEDDSMEQAENNPYAAAMMASVGTVVKRGYRMEDGKGRMDLTITADSPMVSMFNMWITNPQMLEKGAELIEYGPHKAVLKPAGGDGRNLMILLEGKHICEIDARSTTEDQLFAVFDQKAVDALAAVLAK